MAFWAARYTDNIQRDIDRGCSFCGHLAEPGETPDECMELYREAFGPHSSDVFPLWCEEVGGYLPAREGLCAFVGETPEEAIALAREGWDTPTDSLYIFECVVIDEDDDLEGIELGAARVLPTDDAEFIRVE